MHGDLKSGNIMLEKNQRVKLTDYGIIQCDLRFIGEFINMTKEDNLVYMAPQVIKKMGITIASDIWSLGCVIIQMLTGKAPWFGICSKV